MGSVKFLILFMVVVLARCFPSVPLVPQPVSSVQPFSHLAEIVGSFSSGYVGTEADLVVAPVAAAPPTSQFDVGDDAPRARAHAAPNWSCGLGRRVILMLPFSRLPLPSSSLLAVVVVAPAVGPCPFVFQSRAAPIADCLLADRSHRLDKSIVGLLRAD